MVPWVRSGVGAIATQGLADTGYGAKGLELLASGVSPESALRQLLDDDDAHMRRQVAIMGADGRCAVHTGNLCIPYSGHVQLDGAAFLANLMTNPGVPEKMAEAWSVSTGQAIEYRMLGVLIAAQDAGGDIRGQQSAGIKIVDPSDGREWWKAAYVDLRVDDHVDPLTELGRLLDVRFAYRSIERVEDPSSQSLKDSAERSFEWARKVAPQSTELVFWEGVMLANAGEVSAAKHCLGMAFAKHEGWRELLKRLPSVGLLTVDDAVFGDLLNS
jgi:uncharacterized Ntn-hydrolase superfamily protein